MSDHLPGCPFTPVILRVRASWEDRLRKYFVEGNPEDCWEWTGKLYSNGYGHFFHNYQHLMAHRAVYELYKGCVPKDLELDHGCFNRKCVNPNHLEPVTHAINMERATEAGRGAAAFRKNTTHCPKGHEYVEENTYRSKTGQPSRHCKICTLERQRNRRKAKENNDQIGGS